MKNLLWCRRTFIATLAIPAILAIGIYTNDYRAAFAISSVSIGLAAANAYEKRPTTPAVYQTK